MLNSSDCCGKKTLDRQSLMQMREVLRKEIERSAELTQRLNELKNKLAGNLPEDAEKSYCEEPIDGVLSMFNSDIALITKVNNLKEGLIEKIYTLLF